MLKVFVLATNETHKFPVGQYQSTEVVNSLMTLICGIRWLSRLARSGLEVCLGMGLGLDLGLRIGLGLGLGLGLGVDLGLGLGLALA
uniref:Uncharacterized protein n=1 Tax=Romanomermis culicivorax TaxID=13658 RepID=A0A915KDJ0_ROMCU